MLELLQAAGIAASSRLPDRAVDALLIHGNCDLEADLLRRAGELWRAGAVKAILLNGMTIEECERQKINYAGVEPWQRQLTQIERVEAQSVFGVRLGRHTRDEAEAAQSFCLSRGWRELAFLSSPYHILRCCLTQVAAMRDHKASLRLFPVSLGAVDWSEQISKQVLGAEKIHLSRLGMFKEEWDRIERYQAKGDCASLADMIRFFTEQNQATSRET